MTNQDENTNNYGYYQSIPSSNTNISGSTIRYPAIIIYARDPHSQNNNGGNEIQFMKKSPLQASFNSSNAPKLFGIPSCGNYFRQNPTYITDERMVELLNTKNNPCSCVTLSESYINSSSDVIVNGPCMPNPTIDERENDHINRKYSTKILSRMPEISVSGCYSKSCSFLSNSVKAKDKFISYQKAKSIRFSEKEISVFNEKFKEKPYLLREDRKTISELLGISESRVKYWWKKKRRNERMAMASQHNTNDSKSLRGRNNGREESGTDLISTE